MHAGRPDLPEPRTDSVPLRRSGSSAVGVTTSPPLARPEIETGRLIAVVRARFNEGATVTASMLDTSLIEQTAATARHVTEALKAGGKVIFFGNGGSSMDAGHLAAELLGRFHLERPGLAAMSLSDATAAVTAIANDYEYADVFARQLAALGRPGDVAVGLTTSGESENVLRALATARRLGLHTVVLTGATGGRVADVADTCIRVPSTDTARVQEACMLLGHTICEIVEAELFGPPA